MKKTTYKKTIIEQYEARRYKQYKYYATQSDRIDYERDTIDKFVKDNLIYFKSERYSYY